jgi:hypothetical protein
MGRPTGYGPALPLKHLLDRDSPAMPDSPLRSHYVMAGGVRTHHVEAGHNGPPMCFATAGLLDFPAKWLLEKSCRH